jgi:hypothetical protein
VTTFTKREQRGLAPLRVAFTQRTLPARRTLRPRDLRSIVIATWAGSESL